VVREERRVLQCRGRGGDLVDEDVDALAVLHDVRVVPRVAADEHGVSGVVDAVAVGGLDEVAVVHLERGDLHAVAVEDHAVAVELQRSFAAAQGRDAAGHPEVRQPDDVIGVEVRQEDAVDGAEVHAGLGEADRLPPARASTG
jgi:hypothetical protein